MPEQSAQRGMRAPNDQLSRQTLWGIGQSHKQNKTKQAEHYTKQTEVKRLLILMLY